MNQNSPSKCARLTIAATALIAGCGDWPPVAQTKKALEALPPDTQSIRVRGLPDSDVDALARFKSLQILDFWGGHAVTSNRLTDAGIQKLVELDLSRLETLHLGPSKEISDAGLQSLSKLPGLRYLGLAACDRITDAGLQHLAGMKYLEGLDLRGNSAISSQGVIQLERMKGLRLLLLDGCLSITDQSVEGLKASLPNCQIKKDDAAWSYLMQ